jgi:hypothetical protein
VGVWLGALGREQYEAAFRESAIDGAVLPTMTAHDPHRRKGGRRLLEVGQAEAQAEAPRHGVPLSSP